LYHCPCTPCTTGTPPEPQSRKMDCHSMGVGTRVWVKTQAGAAPVTTVGGKDERCACGVNWEESLVMTRTDPHRGEGSTITSPLPCFPTPAPEKQLSDETTKAGAHPHMSLHAYNHQARMLAKPMSACPPHPLRPPVARPRCSSGVVRRSQSEGEKKSLVSLCGGGSAIPPPHIPHQRLIETLCHRIGADWGR